MGNTITTFEPDFKLFCDESCHLSHDNSNVMVFGAIRCEGQFTETVNADIKDIRKKHNHVRELKWTTVNSRQIEFYKEIIEYFARSSCLSFKATIVHNKQSLDHATYNNGSEDDFYYKIAYLTLRHFISKGSQSRLYFDYLNTHGAKKIVTLKNILQHLEPKNLQPSIIRSHESQLIQVCDLLIGAICYANRTDIPRRSKTKNEIIELISTTFGQPLTIGTKPWERKFNLFMFTPQQSKC